MNGTQTMHFLKLADLSLPEHQQLFARAAELKARRKRGERDATLAGRTLVVVPDGALRNVPFAALRDETAGRFLIEQLPLASTPGLTLTDPRPIDRQSAQLLAAGLAAAVAGYPALLFAPGDATTLAQAVLRQCAEPIRPALEVQDWTSLLAPVNEQLPRLVQRRRSLAPA